MCVNPFYLRYRRSQFFPDQPVELSSFLNLKSQVDSKYVTELRILNSSSSFDGYEYNDYFRVPCGSCLYCLIRRAAHCGVRCVHEASLYSCNSFLTLTYSPDHLPDGGNLCRADIDKFLQDLRNYLRRKRNLSFRYYYCAEYGSETSRPHFHLLLFGVDFPDMYPYSKSRKGHLLYRDRVLESIWSKGRVIIGDVTYQSSRYVAAYIFDKFKKNKKNKVPEFISSSRRPGIAYDWISKYYPDVYSQDKVVFYVKGQPRYLPPPRYYDKFMAKNYPDQWESIVKRRIQRLGVGESDDFVFTYQDLLKADARDINLSSMLDSYRRDSI